MKEHRVIESAVLFWVSATSQPWENQTLAWMQTGEKHIPELYNDFIYSKFNGPADDHSLKVQVQKQQVSAKL